MPKPIVGWGAGWVLLCATLLGLGCTSSSSTLAVSASDPESSSPGDDTELDPMIADFLEWQRAAMDRGDLSVDGIRSSRSSIDFERPALSDPVISRIAESDSVQAEVEVADDGSETESSEIAIGMAPREPSIDERLDEAVWALRSVLREQGDSQYSPLSAMLRVALLEAIEAGIFEQTYGPISLMSGRLGLTEDERALLYATLEWARSAHAQFGSDLVDIDRLIEAFAHAGDSVRDLRMLQIGDARLCLRVDTFGVYREAPKYVGRYKFIAGRAHPVIVYTELDRFRSTPATVDGVDGYSVRIRQELLMHRIGTEQLRNSENTVVWQREPESVIDFSRRARRDFFIVQVIEIPANLAVGSYRLKVICTDTTSGQQVEWNIEFDIVADASAFRATAQ